MPRVTFTANLRRLVDCPSADVPGGTVGEALAAAFARSPTLRGYIVDDQERCGGTWWSSSAEKPCAIARA